MSPYGFVADLEHVRDLVAVEVVEATLDGVAGAFGQGNGLGLAEHDGFGVVRGVARARAAGQGKAEDQQGRDQVLHRFLQGFSPKMEVGMYT